MTAQQQIVALPRSSWAPGDFAWVVRTLLRRWLFVVLGAIVGVVAMVGVMMLSSPTYDVTAKVFVRLGREMAAPPVFGASDGSQAMPASKRPEDVASEVEILTNPLLLKKTVDYFGEDFFLGEAPDTTLWQKLKRIPKEMKRWVNDGMRNAMVILGLRPETTPLERVTLAIASGLNVEAVRKSDVIEVTIGFPDPKGGEMFLNKFLEYALESHVEAYRNNGTRQFFAKERDQLAAQLKAAEQRLLSLRSAHNGSWSAPDQRSLLLKAEADLQFQLAQANTDAAQAAAESARSRAALDALSPEITLSTVKSRNKRIEEMETRLQQLLQNLVTLRVRYTDDSPEIIDLQRQADFLQTSINAESAYLTDGVTTGPNQQYESLRRDLIALGVRYDGQTARAAELERQLKQLRAQILGVQQSEIEIAEADREVTRLRRSLDLYDKGFDDAKTAEAMDAAEISNLQVIMPPTSSILPSSPSIKKFLIMGLGGGIALTIGLILLQAMWIQSFATRRKASGGQARNLPSVASVE